MQRRSACRCFVWICCSSLLSASAVLRAADWYWYLDLNNVTTYLDAYGRPQPDVNRWPLSTGMRGFKRLTDYIHSKGMLFGLHVMRGISEVAVEYQLPVLGTNYTADQIYDPDRMCPWSCVPVSRFYALKKDHPGSQAFYDSLYAQYAEWGVDIIKADCYFGDYYLLDQIEAVSDGINHSGRPMLLSLSAGNGPHDDQVEQATTVTPLSNVYRMTEDTWADWQAWHIYNHWEAARRIVDFLGGAKTGRYGLPAYPDYDNPPFGFLTDPYQGRIPHFMSPLTRDEQYTVAAFWMFSRAPMFYEGDLRTPDSFSLGLVTNPRAIAMTDYSANISVVHYSLLNTSVWSSQSTADSASSYVALFNIADDKSQTVSVDLSAVSPHGSSCSLQEIWNGTVTTNVQTLTLELPVHGSGLYRVYDCKNSTAVSTD